MALKSLSEDDIVLLARVARASRALAFDRCGSFAFCERHLSQSLLRVEKPWDTIGALDCKKSLGEFILRCFRDTSKELVVVLGARKVVAIPIA